MCTTSRKFLAQIGLLDYPKETVESPYISPREGRRGPVTERKASVWPKLFHEKECYIARELLHQWGEFHSSFCKWLLLICEYFAWYHQEHFRSNRTSSWAEQGGSVNAECLWLWRVGMVFLLVTFRPVQSKQRKGTWLFLLKFYINSIYRCCLQHFVVISVGSCVSVAYVSLGNLQTGKQQLYLTTETCGGSRLGPYPHSLRYPQSCWRWW